MKLACLLVLLCAGPIACRNPSAPETPAGPAGETPSVDAGPAAEGGDPVDAGRAPEQSATDADAARAAMPGASYTPKTRIEAGLEKQSQSARADLAGRLGVDAGSIELVQAQSVMWPNSGLGCAEPDTMYLDVLTPGVRVLLRSGGKVYEYHGGRTSAPFLCEPAERIRQPLPPGSYDDGT